MGRWSLVAPKPTYPAPHKQLGLLMVEARRDGLSFDEFWSRSMRPQMALVMVTDPDPPVGAVRWPTDRNDRVAWRGAILEMEAGWRRAYDREPPSRGERALALLADEIGALAEVVGAVELEEIPAAA